jgi:hypothetical protein
MELFNSSEFRLIKKDFSNLRKDLFEENNINDWDKLIIIYNFYLLLNYVYFTYDLLNIVNKDNADFRTQFLSLYLFFYCFTSMQSCYLYFIKNVCKINYKLGLEIHQNLKDFFIF